MEGGVGVGSYDLPTPIQDISTYGPEPKKPFRDILDRDRTRQIQQVTVTRRVDNSWWILLTISIILILAFWLYLAYLSLESIPRLVATGTAAVLITCPPDQCATNIYNGEKRCPLPGQTIISDSSYEICVTAGLCDNSRNPYAVMSDESTNLEGVCETDPATGNPVTCRCLSRPQCANYILSGWNTYTGNAYVGLNQQRTSFTQFTASDPDADNVISNNSPLSYIDDGNKFCQAPASWVARSTPGCSFLQEITPQSMTLCMGASQGCQDIPISNPCSRGTLAYVTDDSDGFGPGSINVIPLGCVEGSACGCGQVAIYDTKLGQIVCKAIV